MKSNNHCYKKAYRSFSVFLALAILFLSSLSYASSRTPLIGTKDSMLQFKSGNHIVGFTPERAYFVSTDHALSVKFIGANKVKPQPLSHPESTSRQNNQATPGSVEYKELWPGVTLRYDAVKGGLAESTYIVAPGAEVSNIRLKYNVPVSLQKDGSLKLAVKSKLGSMTESAPVAWQEIDNRKVPVKVAFNIANGEVGFKTDKYDPKYPLIIDPTFAWTSFSGSSSNDYGISITCSLNGDIYVSGYSYAEWIGPSGQQPINAFTYSQIGGMSDLFILKYDSSGTYQWHTFYGSSSDDAANGIAVDKDGNVYVAGYSFGSWGSPLNPFTQSQIGGTSDIFILKLNSAGAYQWHTFYGNSSNDSANGIAVDKDGNVYVAGYSFGSWGSPLNPFTQSQIGGTSDIFVLKLNSAGAYQWHTFYGNSSNDSANGIAVDKDGNVYVAGYSFGSWGSPLNPFTQSQIGGTSDIFVLKLNSAGAYQWHTFYGNSSNDSANGIAVDNGGNVYVAGYSFGSWGSPLNPFTQSQIGGISDIFVLKLNSAGAYQWHTFYGSSSEDVANGIAVDKNGSAYVTGYSLSTGNSHISTIKLSSAGALLWLNSFGPISPDTSKSIAVDIAGNIYATGYNWSTSTNSWAVFIIKFLPSTCLSHAAGVSSSSGYSYYSSFQAAYDNHKADGGNLTILLQALDFHENITLDSNTINIQLKGGYECDFPSDPPGFSTISGSFTIKGGSVTVDSIIIK